MTVLVPMSMALFLWVLIGASIYAFVTGPSCLGRQAGGRRLFWLEWGRHVFFWFVALRYCRTRCEHRIGHRCWFGEIDQ